MPAHLAGLADALYRAGLAFLAFVAPAACERTEAPRRREAATVEAQGDVVWSASSLVRIVEGDRVVRRVDLHKTVTAFAFDPQHDRTLVAASDGVHVLSLDGGAERRHLTTSPARSLRIAHGRAWVLEHDVAPGPDGTPVSTPYRLREIELATLETAHVVEVGERVLAFAPPLPGKRVLLLAESGFLRAVDWPGAQGGPLDPAGEGRPRAIALSPDASKAYVGVEGPSANVVEIDLATMSRRAIPLGREAAIRGIAVSGDGRTLFLNALRSIARVDLAGGTTRFAPLDGPHQELAISRDGRRLWIAKPVHEAGGALTVVDAESLAFVRRVVLDDISPFTIAVR